MEDEITVPALVSVYKAEVWRHLGFCGNVRPRTVVRALPRFRCLPCPVWRAFAQCAAGGRVAARLQLSLIIRGRFVQLGRCSRRGLGDSTRNKYKLKNLWNPSWNVLRIFNICIYFIVLQLFCSITLNVTRTDYCKCRSQCVVVKLFIYC